MPSQTWQPILPVVVAGFCSPFARDEYGGA